MGDDISGVERMTSHIDLDVAVLGTLTFWKKRSLYTVQAWTLGQR
jgi:hypothetical protein